MALYKRSWLLKGYFISDFLGTFFFVKSKVGDCMLNTYSSHSVPIGIAADLKDTVEYCDHCEQSFVISSNVPDNVRVYADRITEE